MLTFPKSSILKQVEEGRQWATANYNWVQKCCCPRVMVSQKQSWLQHWSKKIDSSDVSSATCGKLTGHAHIKNYMWSQKNCLLIKREYTFRTNQTPWNINTSVLPHFVSGADYMYSTKIYDSSTNALVSMICQWASDTLKHSACISTIRNNTFQTCSVKHVCLEHLPDVRLKACRNSSKLICPLPTLKTSHMYIVSQKRIPNILNYNSSKNCLTSIIFGKYINKRLGNQRVVYFPTLHKVSLHYLVKQKKTQNHIFSL